MMKITLASRYSRSWQARGAASRCRPPCRRATQPRAAAPRPGARLSRRPSIPPARGRALTGAGSGALPGPGRLTHRTGLDPCFSSFFPLLQAIAYSWLRDLDVHERSDGKD